MGRFLSEVRIPNISATTLHKYEFVSHPTLPQPLQLKIVIGDKFGETKELQIEQFNFIPQIPQDAYTKIIEKSYMEPLARYVFCEDLNSHNHMKVMKFALVDNKLNISFHEIERKENVHPKMNEMYNVELNKTDIQELERKSRTGLNEINYPFYNYTMSHVNVKITFLFNDGHLYGARVFIDTCSHTMEKVAYLRDFIRVVIF